MMETGKLAFLSTVPSLVSLIPSTSAVAPTFFSTSSKSRITANFRVDAELGDECRLPRRRILHCIGLSVAEWGLFDKQFGRSDPDQPDPEGRVPPWDKSSGAELKSKFSAIGFGLRQLAVLSAFFGRDQSAKKACLPSDPEVLPWIQKYQRSHETVSQTDMRLT